jgi:hypothetical protein
LPGQFLDFLDPCSAIRQKKLDLQKKACGCCGTSTLKPLSLGALSLAIGDCWWL